MRCVTREPIATTSLPRELMTQKRWVDVEDFATDSEREAIDGDEPEPEIGWRASLDVWPQLCSRTPVVQVILCDTMGASPMQLRADVEVFEPSGPRTPCNIRYKTASTGQKPSLGMSYAHYPFAEEALKVVLLVVVAGVSGSGSI